MTKGDRIELAMRRMGLDKTALARLVGKSQQSISYLISGKFPGKTLTVEVASALGVAPEWLNVGDNPPAWAVSTPAGDNRLREPSADYGHATPSVALEAIQRDLARSRAEIADLQLTKVTACYLP
jgi:plasmid maintenance system antidote protein VapI